jgi:hypothetical protein
VIVNENQIDAGGVLMDGATGDLLTHKRSSPANVAASQTDSSLVTAVTAKRLRVVWAYAQCGGTATTVVFNTKPSGAGTAISPTFQNAANGGFVLPYNPHGWFTTNSGEGLTVTTGSGAATGVQVGYVEIT